MKKIDRFRRPEQLLLFDPPKRRPVWTDLPQRVTERALELLVTMLEDHVQERTARKKGGERDV